MSMNRLTVEETNLLSIYHDGSKAQLVENMTAALPFMDEDMRELAKRTLSKVDALTEAEYRGLAVYPADEV
jgi:pyruvate/2-oxoglutarate dehydrogenase complex dihydrolipoamide dehydrogenase (E3) component